MDEQDKQIRTLTKWNRLLSYILVAMVASAVTFFLCLKPAQSGGKLQQLEQILTQCFIGETDIVKMEDAAAAAMVASLGDRWSYYISAADYGAYLEQVNNAYVGIGITVLTQKGDAGFVVTKVEAAGGAEAAGIRVGDVVIAVNGQKISDLGADAAREQIRGKENTWVKLTLFRGETQLELDVERKTIKVPVAQGQMLENKIGLIKIYNFDERCTEETLAAVDQLCKDGAQSLIFDVRNNPGGFKHEMVDILNYLLPEGDLFRSLNYKGEESVDTSDADCLKMPMAVIVNGESYSAAEFFAAALEEYDWAVTVGEQTCGKGYFQNTIKLSDGSAVGLSVGKYFTPNGVSLAEAGGLTPQILVEVDEKTAAAIYAGTLTPQEDPQIQAAITALTQR